MTDQTTTIQNYCCPTCQRRLTTLPVHDSPIKHLYCEDCRQLVPMGNALHAKVQATCVVAVTLRFTVERTLEREDDMALEDVADYTIGQEDTLALLVDACGGNYRIEDLLDEVAYEVNVVEANVT